MAAFFLYIVKVSCCLTLFYVGYKALLSNETFFRYNRAVLLIGMAVCMLLPLIRIKTDTITAIQLPMIRLEKIISEEATSPVVAGIEGIPATVSDTVAAGFPLLRLLFLVFVGGSVVHLFIICRSLFYLRRIIRSGTRIERKPHVIILHDQISIPFSFGKYIVLSENDYKNNQEIILTHEAAHSRKRHSFDLLFSELIILLQWFNPVAWLLKRELHEVHEFQADMEVLNQGIDATTYQLLLVKKAVGSSSYTFANSFNHSKLKKRITMMLRKKSNQWARLKLTLLIPVAVLSVHAFARPEISRQLERFIQSEDTSIPQQNKGYTPEFYEAELNKYINQLQGDDTGSLKEKSEFLKNKTNGVDLLVNSLGEILFNFEFTSIDQLATAVKNVLFTDYQNKKPVLINIMIDKGAPADIQSNIWNIVGEIFASEKDRLESRKQPILVILNSPKNYSMIEIPDTENSRVE